jgi:signal transduction histidine kinase
LLRCEIDQDSKFTDLVEKIENAQRQLINLFEDVRRYAAPITLRREPYRLNQLVQETWDSFRKHPKRVRFSHLPSELNLTIELDVAAIGQVLKLLFENAVSTEANSSTIDVRYAADQIDGVAAITLFVSDDGVGIPLSNRERAFQPFFTMKSHGTGLGLSICKRIVDAHRGRIYFGNALLGGTTVCTTLPISISRD